MVAAQVSSRTARLASVIESEGIDVFFAHSPITMGYLNGFFEDGHERFLTLAIRKTGESRLICPALSESQARRCGIEDVRSWRDGENPLPLLEELGREWDLRSAILAVDDTMPAHMLLRMQSVLPAALFRQGQPYVSALMRNKEPEELDLLRKAAKIADDAYDAALPQVKIGMTERDLDDLLYSEMRKRGGKPTFSISGVGPNSAEPHHMSDETPIRDGDLILMDFGCSVEGYQSDITRVASMGKASDEAKKVYEIVLAGHMASRRQIRAGVPCGSVDAAGRDVIAAAGYGDRFVHRTGHGIGLRGHEEPYIIGGSEEVLEPGQTFSIEPGIYIPGKFGVRIENIVCATESGHESLNREPSPTLVEL